MINFAKRYIFRPIDTKKWKEDQAASPQSI